MPSQVQNSDTSELRLYPHSHGNGHDSFQSPVVDTTPHLDPPVLGFGPGHVPPPVSVPTHQFPRNGASSSRVGTASSPIDLESGFAEFTPSPLIGEFVTSGGHRLVHGGASSSVNWDEERERIVSSSSSVRKRGGASSSVSPPVGGPAWAPSQGLHSRYHRNLSEELLALEEVIGNVSTGLTEESVAKRLKQHNYSSSNHHISMEEEPCCICQKEYVEGDELARPDCGHGFHSSCIKQWLTHKNLCPICKNTRL